MNVLSSHESYILQITLDFSCYLYFFIHLTTVPHYIILIKPIVCLRE